MNIKKDKVIKLSIVITFVTISYWYLEKIEVGYFRSEASTQSPVSRTLTISCPSGLSPSFFTTTGCVQGILSSDGNREMFLGIPYAKPPVRFARPEPVEPWTTPFIADKFGAACIQYPEGDPTGGFMPTGSTSEDCLSLNIWRPVGASGLPIIFFIHGGGNRNGAGSASAYADKPDLAKNAIVVTINYRLGAAGQIAHPNLSLENSDGTSGSWLFYDILLALKWVNANAVALGGNPQKLLVFGQSAGAGTVFDLLTSPLAGGLFTSALIESGPYLQPIAQPMLLRGNATFTGESLGLKFAQTLGCDPPPSIYSGIPECLRAKSVEDLQNAWQIIAPSEGSQPWGGPYIDGVVLTDEPRKLLEMGQFNRVPVFMGVMSLEIGPFIAFNVYYNTWEELDAALVEEGTKLGVKDLEGLVQLYHNKTSYSSPGAAYGNFLYDSAWLCPARAVLQVVDAQNVPARGYYNSHGPSFQYNLPAHAMDLYFIFGSAAWKSYFTKAELNFAAMMQSTWASVAVNSPNIPKLGAWPLFKSGTWVNFDIKPKIVTSLRQKECDFFDSQNIFFP